MLRLFQQKDGPGKKRHLHTPQWKNISLQRKRDPRLPARMAKTLGRQTDPDHQDRHRPVPDGKNERPLEIIPIRPDPKKMAAAKKDLVDRR